MSQQAKLTALDGATGSFFGFSVAVNGDTVVVGANGWNNYRGAVYIFTRTGNSWSLPSELTAPQPVTFDYFGNSVAVNGGTIVVGAPGRNQNTGAAYIFLRQGAGWNLQASVTANDGATFTSFAGALALDGSTLLAGNIGGTSSLARGNGAWYVFQIPSGPVASNAASLVTGPIAPGELITLMTDLGPDNGVAATPAPGGAYPTQLGGVQVFFDGAAAPILYAQKQQVNVQAPFELSNGTTQVHIEYNGLATWPSTLVVQPAAPAIFHAGGAQALVLNQDQTWNSPSNPAPAGSVVSVWGTGGGVFPGNVTGGLTPLTSQTRLTLPVTVMLGGTAIAATVTYSGVAPTLSSGVFQINFQIPVGAPALPAVTLSIAAGSITGIDPPAGTTIALK